MMDDDVSLLPDSTPLKHLGLYTRSLNALHGQGVLTLGQLRAMGHLELLRTSGLGRVGIEQIRGLVPDPDMPSKDEIEPGKRFPLNMRTTKEIRDKLEVAAKESGRSLVQEVEYRLQLTFDLEKLADILEKRRDER